MVRSMWLNCFYINRQILLKEGEVDAAVMAVLNETGMLGEVVVLAMLENQETAFAQKITFEYHVGKFGDFLQHIGRVCKDEVELLPALTDVLEDIAFNGDGRKVLQLVYELLDEPEMQRILLYAYDTGTSTGKQFKSDATGSCKQVKGNRFIFPINIGIKNVEEILLGKVGSGTCLECTGNIEMTSLVFTCYYTHI